MSWATIGSNPSTINRVTTTQDREGKSTSSLEATTETEHKVEGALLLDVVIRKSATVLELLASEDETLLVRRDPLLVLNLRLHIVDRVGRLDLQGDGLAREGLDEDLHTTTETKDWDADIRQNMRQIGEEDSPRWSVDSFWML